MGVRSSYIKFLVAGMAALVAAIFLWIATAGPSTVSSSASITEPPLSARATEGKLHFEANCASCHGMRGAGTDKGPPFIHDIYNPGHHSDAAFLAAAKLGVRQHHWRFGNMPAQPQVSDQQATAIVQYVREVQKANGITFRPHHM